MPWKGPDTYGEAHENAIDLRRTNGLAGPSRTGAASRRHATAKARGAGERVTSMPAMANSPRK